MDLYKYYRNDEYLLDNEINALDRIPGIFWYKFIGQGEKGRKEIIKRSKYVAKSPEHAFYYARNFIKGPWPEGEAAIATNAEYAAIYAIEVLQKPWPEAEDVIATDYNEAYEYASFLGDRFKKGEKVILKSNRKNDYIEMLKDNGISIDF